MTPQEDDEGLQDPHQDIHDALGILPTGGDRPVPPWKYPAAPTGVWDRLRWDFESRFPKNYFNPEKAKGTPWQPGVWDPSWTSPATGRQTGGLGLTQLAPPSALQKQIAAGPPAVLGGISNALGITDAGRALRGEMTEDEARNFALGALPGLLPGGKPTGEMIGLAAKAGKAFERAAAPLMEDLFPHSGVLGKIGKMTPSEYVAGFGDAHQFAKTFPQSFKVIEPHLSEDQKTELAMGQIHDALGVKEGFDQKDISQRAIDKQLAKNPGASIFDVAGQGPSMNYAAKAQMEKDYTTANKLRSSDFPHEVPFGVPPRAQALGFTTPALHGTPDRWGWEGPLDQLKLPEDQLGVHFGNPAQAARFNLPGDPHSYLNNPSTYENARFRTYPAVLQIQNPLEMRDMGSWHPRDIKEALRSINAGEHVSYVGGQRPVSLEHKGLFPDREVDKLDDIRSVRDYIASKGFDSVKYTNSVEDPGHTSYILFHDAPTQPGYVIGARSPFAQFDPSKLHLPSLTAAGAGILAYPLLSRNGREQQ